MKHPPPKVAEPPKIRCGNQYFLVLWCLLLLSVSCQNEAVPDVSPAPPPVPSQTTFTNPLLPSGPDPWVFQQDSFYYYTHTLGNRIGLAKTKAISQLQNQPLQTVWTPPAGQPYSYNLWAPELHRMGEKWYLYFAADDGQDANHRMYVLENPAPDPTTGTWTFKGKIADTTDRWAIDGTVLEHKGQLYYIWSGWRGANDPGIQQLYIAGMTNPWTLEGARVLLSEPTYPWERNGLVNEGPAVLENSEGRVFLVYSASGCWTDEYALGLLSLKEGGNPLVPADWTKSPNPVFRSSASSSAYGPGHNGFFKSPDRTQDWIIYHANARPGQGCSDARNPRMQEFSWNTDGTPAFGLPASIGSPLPRPSGEVR